MRLLCKAMHGQGRALVVCIQCLTRQRSLCKAPAGSCTASCPATGGTATISSSALCMSFLGSQLSDQCQLTELLLLQVPGSLMSRMFSGEVPVSKVKQVQHPTPACACDDSAHVRAVLALALRNACCHAPHPLPRPLALHQSLGCCQRDYTMSCRQRARSMPYSRVSSQQCILHKHNKTATRQGSVTQAVNADGQCLLRGPGPHALQPHPQLHAGWPLRHTCVAHRATGTPFRSQVLPGVHLRQHSIAALFVPSSAAWTVLMLNAHCAGPVE